MATNPPGALLDHKVSGSASCQQLDDQSNTNRTTSNSSSVHTANKEGQVNAATNSPKPPLRPPRGGHGNLVRPRDELQPPPAATTAGNAKGQTSVGGGVVGVRKSTCKQCTNISIMQLFYEMKNRFPTVTDEIVNDCVLEHCHQREHLLEVLHEHSESNQTLVPHSYPAKLFRGSAENVGGAKKRKDEAGQQQSTGDNKSRQSNTNTIPRRSKGSIGAALVAAAVPLVGMISGQSLANGAGGPFRRQSDTNNPKATGVHRNHNDAVPSSSSDMQSNGGSFISNSIQRMAIISGDGPVPNKVERPCTLNLSPAPNRPFRTAPPIPSTTSSTSSLSSLSTATDLASASSPQLTASNESINVSVNVTLSPILPTRSTVAAAAGSHHPQAAHVLKPPIPPRHTTELTVQPEVLPFVPTVPTRSFTSVNFTLRQPTSGSGEGAVTAAPIDISTAGSSMTYSSSSYNAKQGYQSQLQITVGNGGGSISAIRTKAPTMVTTTTPAAAGSSLMGSSRPGLSSSSARLDADSEGEE